MKKAQKRIGLIVLLSIFIILLTLAVNIIANDPREVLTSIGEKINILKEEEQTEYEETIERDVRIIWDDDNDKERLRPEKISLQLKANGEYQGSSVVVTEDNDWLYIYENLEKNKDGEEIEYTLASQNIIGYTKTATDNGFTIKYTHETEKYSKNVDIILESLNTNGLLQDGTKIKIQSEDELDIKVLDAVTYDELSKDDESAYTIPATKAIIRVDNIVLNKKYEIKVEETGVKEGNNRQFDYLILELDTTNETIKSRIKTIVRTVKDENGEDKVITIDGSAENIAKFNNESEIGTVTIRGDNGVIAKYKIGKDGEWQDYNENIIVPENETIYIKTIKNNVEGTTLSKKVVNIDKEAPQITNGVVRTVDEEVDGELVTHIYYDVKASDQEGFSGIVKYGLSLSPDEEPEWINCDNSLALELTLEITSGAGEYYFWTKDLAGNVGKSPVTVELDVVEITVSPVESLVGTRYTSIESAVNALKDNGLTAESESSTLTVIRNITNQSSTVSDTNIVLDLNGYIVNSKTVNTINITDNAKVLLTDTQSKGKVQNEVGTAIKVGTSGTLTIGYDDKKVSRTNPEIEGHTYGIENNGIFNFYDGKIVGDIAIRGNITDKAYLKEASIDTETVEDREIATLVTISNAEAAIGKKTYVHIEDAIDEANRIIKTSDEQVEIVVLKNIQRDADFYTGENSELDKVLKINDTKNIKINMNGYSLFLPYGLENKGKVEIIDEMVFEDEEEQRQGRINFESTGELDNKGEFTLTSGTISSSRTGVASSQNSGKDSLIKNTGKFKIGEGIISTSGSNLRIIHNNGGEIKIQNGEITTSGSDNCGIYNENDGIVEIDNVIMNIQYGNGIENDNSEINIYNCTMDTYGRTSIINNDGVINISGGSITTDAWWQTTIYSIYSNSGEINISGGDLYAHSGWGTYGIYGLNGAKINIVDARGSISGVDVRDTSKLKIENSNCGFVSVNGSGDVTITNSLITGVLSNTSTSKVTVEDSNIQTSSGDFTSSINNSGSGIIETINTDISANGGRYTTVISNGESGTINITGGTIQNYTSNRPYNNIANSGIMNITDSIIKGSAINNNSNGALTLNNIESYITVNNNSTQYINIKDGKIDAGDGVNNKSSGIINIEGANIKGSGNYAVENSGTGTVNVKSGTLIGRSYIIRNLSTGKIIIGDKDGNIEDDLVSMTCLNGIGIYNLGELYFYDGTITAAKEKTILGCISDIEKESSLYVDINDDSTETAYLSSGENVARIIESTDSSLVNTEYKSLNDAIDKAVNKGDKIQVLVDASIYGNIEIEEEKELTIDIAGHKIISYAIIENNGKLSIEDNSDEHTGEIYNISEKLINNTSTGTLNIENTKINSNQTSYDGVHLSLNKLIYNTGELNFTNSTLSVNGGGSYGIYNDGEGTVNINGGTYGKTGSGEETIYNNGSGTINVKNATVSHSSFNRNSCIYNKEEGTILLENVKVTNDYTNNYGTMIIKGEETNITPTMNNYGKMTIENGTTNTITSNGILNIIGGKVAGVTSNDTGDVTITGGEITSSGIRNNGTGTVVIGTKDGDVNTESPKIVSSSIGIYNNTGYLKLYDGRIEGSATVVTEEEGEITEWSNGQSIVGPVSDLEEDYTTVRSAYRLNATTIREVTILGQIVVAEKWIDGNKVKDYYSLDKAIKEAEDDTEVTIKMLMDNSITNQYTITEDQNIILDLNGYKLNAGKLVEEQEEQTIEIPNILNNGKFTIKDEIGTGSIPISGKTLIENNNIFTLKSGSLSSSIINAELIKNNGTFNMDGGEIGLFNGYITALNGGQLNMNGGEIYTEYMDNILIRNSALVMTGGKLRAQSNYSGIMETDKDVDITGGILIHTGNYAFGITNNATEENIHINVSGDTEVRNYSNGSFINNRGIANVNISGNVDIDESGTLISNYNKGKVTISGGKINATGTIVYNESTDEVEVTGGTLSSENFLVNNVNSGYVKITGGKFIGTGWIAQNTYTGIVDVENIESTGNGKIANNTGSGTINISNIDTTIEKNSVNIISNTGANGKININENVKINSIGNSVNVILNGGRDSVLNINNKIDINLTGDNSSAIGTGYNSKTNINDIDIIVEGTNSRGLTLGTDYSDATITLLKGNVKATGIGARAFNNGNKGTIIIGNKDSEFTNGNDIVIEGEEYGIFNSNYGILKIYDGKITGPEDKSIVGPVEDVREGYNIDLNIVDGKETAKLGNENIVINVTTGVSYKSLKATIEALSDTDTAVFKPNQRLFIPNREDEKIEIKEGQTVTIDFNGKVIENSLDEWITNNGTLKIENTEGTINVYKTSGIKNSEDATLIISNSRINIGGVNGNLIKNEGMLEVEKSEITSSVGTGIYNVSNGSVEINDNSILTCAYYAINNENQGQVVIEDSTISGGRTGIWNKNSGTLNVTNSEIISTCASSGEAAIYNNSIEECTIVDSTLVGAGSYGIQNNTLGEINIIGGTIKGGYSGIWNKSNGQLSVENAEIISTSTSSGEAGIYNSSNGTILFKSGKITSQCHGIYNRSTAKVVIGSEDGIVQDDLVLIQGNLNGLYVNNTNAEVKFYDGTIKGNSGAINNRTNIMCEDGYEVQLSENDTVAKLGLKDVEQEGVVSVQGGVYYNKIEKAIRAIDEGTILVHRTIEADNTIVIPSGKNITIDLRENRIKFNSEVNPVIRVETGATLTIIDSYEDGNQSTYARIENEDGPAIQNKGTLVIGIDDGVEYTNSPRIIGDIENDGTCNVYDGQATVVDKELAFENNVIDFVKAKENVEVRKAEFKAEKIVQIANVMPERYLADGTTGSGDIALSKIIDISQDITEWTNQDVHLTIDTYARPELMLYASPDSVDKTVEVVWDDGNNQDGIRPDDVNVQLKANNENQGEAVKVEKEDWTYTYEGLAKNNNGQAITYTLTSEAVEGYTNNVETTETGFKVTYTHTPEVVNKTVEVVWNDGNNQDGIRPEKVTVQLKANNTNQGDPIEITADDNWTYEFTSLDKNKDGREISYTLDSEEVSAYDKTTQSNGFDITYIHTPEKISKTVEVEWNDNNNQDGLRPEEVTVKLKVGNTEKESKEIKETNNWEGIFENLDKNSNGTAIVYELTTSEVPGYTSVVTTTATGFKVTYTHSPETIVKTLTINWDDQNDNDRRRPESIQIQLYDGETAIDEPVTINKPETETNIWTYEWPELPAFRNGRIAEYRVEIADIVEDYDEVDDGDDDSFTKTLSRLITLYVQEVEIVWDDDNNSAGKRPEGVMVQLYQENDKYGDEISLPKEEKWFHIWTVSKYKNGEEQHYTVKQETDLSELGYTTTYVTNENKVIITNKYTPASVKTTKKVQVRWDDQDNYDGYRPEKVKVQLYQNDEPKGTPVEIDNNENWTYTWENIEEVPETEYTYRVEEIEVNERDLTEYTVTKSKDEETFIITNTHTIRQTTRKVQIVWDDENDKDGIRPVEVNVQLYINGTSNGELVKIKGSEEWQHIWNNLPELINKLPVTYMIRQDEVD